MVWAETSKLGCGHISYRDGGFIKKYLVCNYGPGGNTIGRPMYSIGRACGACQKCSNAFPGLCASDESTSIATTGSNNVSQVPRPTQPTQAPTPPPQAINEIPVNGLPQRPPPTIFSPPSRRPSVFISRPSRRPSNGFMGSMFNMIFGPFFNRRPVRRPFFSFNN